MPLQMSPGQQHAGDPHELVRVYSVHEPTLAELLRQELVAQGIRCEISGENQAGLTGVLNVDLLVQATDVDRARELLAELEARQASSPS